SITIASSSRPSSRLRSFAGTRSFSRMVDVNVDRCPASTIPKRAAATSLRDASEPAFVGTSATGRIPQLVDDALGIIEVGGVDRGLDLLDQVGGQLVHVDRGALHHARELDRTDVLLHALVDR